MSCNIQVFDKLLNNEEVEKLNIEGVYSIFENYIKNSLDDAFVFENNTFKTISTPTKVHTNLLSDIESRFKKQIFVKESEGIYSFHQENVAEIIATAFEVILGQQVLNEANFAEDISYSLASSNNNMLPVDVIKRYLEYLEQQKIYYEKELKDINKSIKKESENPNTTERILIALNREKLGIIRRLEGVIGTSNIGLYAEIKRLQDPVNQTVEVLMNSFNEDMERVNFLLHNPTYESVREAENILDYYYKSTNFYKMSENPLFSNEDFYFEDDTLKLDDITINNLTTINTIVQQKISNMGKKEIDAVMKVIHNNPSLQGVDYRKVWEEAEANIKFKQATLDENATEEEAEQHKLQDMRDLYEQLFGNAAVRPDISWFDMWMLEMHKSIYNPDSMSQIIMSEMTATANQYAMVAALYTQDLERLEKNMKPTLKKLGYDNSVFKEKNKNGKLTGSLIRRFSAEFYHQIEGFQRKLITEKNQKVKKKQLAWLYNNAIMLKVSLLPEIEQLFNKTEYRLFFDEKDFRNDNGKHKQELIAVLGAVGYEELVKEQIDKMNAYITTVKAMKANLFAEFQINNPGVSMTTWNELLAANASAEQIYKSITNKNPFSQEKIFNMASDSVSDLTDFEFTTFIPKNTEDYNKDFKNLEANKETKEYYDLVSKMLEQIYLTSPYINKNVELNPLLIPTWKKSIREEWATSDSNIVNKILMLLSRTFREGEVFLLSLFTANPESLSDYWNPITKKFEPKVRAFHFFTNNQTEIEGQFNVEATKWGRLIRKYLKDNGSKNIKSNEIDRFTINRFTKMFLDDLPDTVIMELASRLNKDFNSIAEAKKYFADNYKYRIPIGKILFDDIIHQNQINESLNLTRTISYSYTQAMHYKAKVEAEPKISLMRKHYFEMEKANPKIRERASDKPSRRKKRFDNWMDRVVYHNFSKDIGAVRPQDVLLDEIKAQQLANKLNAKKRFKNKEERILDKRIKELFYGDLTKEEQDRLLRTQKNLGKNLSFGQIFTNLLKYLRWKGLAVPGISDIGNYTAGQIANQVLDAQGFHFPTGTLAEVQNIMRGSTLRFWTFGLVSPIAKKSAMIRELVDRWQILQDPRNELQQSLQRQKLNKYTSFTLKAFEHVTRVEYLNQVPLVLCIMKDTKIKGMKNGVEIETDLTQAFDKNGRLKESFRTEENINNWELSNTDISRDKIKEFLKFKERVTECLKSAHGDYSDTGGNMIKSSVVGNVLFMFKGWWARQIFWRLHEEYYDFSIGRKTKGRYRSVSSVSAMSMGAIAVGVPTFLALFPGIVTAGVVAGSLGLGAAAGYTIQKIFLGRLNKQEKAKIKLHANPLMEATIFTSAVILKYLGMPINRVLSRYVIPDGIIQEKFSKGLSEIDAKNVKGNITDIAIQLQLLTAQFLITILVNSLVGDDDDENKKKHEEYLTRLEKYSPLRFLIVNMTNKTLDEMNMYTSPTAMLEFSVGNIGLLTTLQKVEKIQTLIYTYMVSQDFDINPKTGESNLATSAKKLLPPNLITFYNLVAKREVKSAYTEKQFMGSASDFWSKGGYEKRVDSIIQAKRKQKKEEYKEQGLSEREARRKVNKELITDAERKDIEKGKFFQSLLKRGFSKEKAMEHYWIKRDLEYERDLKREQLEESGITDEKQLKKILDATTPTYNQKYKSSIPTKPKKAKKLKLN